MIGLWYLLGGLEDLVSKAITTLVRVISKYQYDCFLYNHPKLKALNRSLDPPSG